MANYVAKFGNIYVFPAYAVGTALKLEFDRPIKRFRFCSSGPALTDDSGVQKAIITANSDISLDSANGLPDYIMFLGTAAGSPVVQVSEFGVDANKTYWKDGV